MKTAVTLYGRIIVLVIVLSGILGYLFRSGSGTFEAAIPEPKASVSSEDSVELVDDIAVRADPVLTIQKKKLSAGVQYRLLDFVSAKNADGTSLPVTVVWIKKPDGSYVSSEGTETFTKGIYEVRYRAEETYQNVVKFDEKTAVYAVD